MSDARNETQELAQQYASIGKADQWFEEFYSKAGGDIHNIYWADLKPNPLLSTWLAEQPDGSGKRAVTIGCGLGDDAEEISRFGYDVVAFDISQSAINMCTSRYPKSAVEYCVQDLFALPSTWVQGFDLVYECNTIQILSGDNRSRAMKSISTLVGTGGTLLVSCRSRIGEEGQDQFPVALNHREIEGFVREGLTEQSFLAYDDDQEPPVPHFFASYCRKA